MEKRSSDRKLNSKSTVHLETLETKETTVIPANLYFYVSLTVFSSHSLGSYSTSKLVVQMLGGFLVVFRQLWNLDFLESLLDQKLFLVTGKLCG